MQNNPVFALDDQQEIERIIRENPWAILVSAPESGLVASHYPVLLDEGESQLAVLSHFGRADAELHEIGRHELLVTFQGAHGYISSGWYDEDHAVPTWNFFAVHLAGIPEILTPDENLRVLNRFVDHFEGATHTPRRLMSTEADEKYATRLAQGTVGIRLVPTRVTAKRKMSQNRSEQTVTRIMHELSDRGPYANPALLDEMRRIHGDDGSTENS